MLIDAALWKEVARRIRINLLTANSQQQQKKEQAYGAKQDFPRGADGKASAYNAGDPGSIPELGRSQRRKWQPTPVFLPGESHGQWNLVGYSPWGHKESDTTEQLHFRGPNTSIRIYPSNTNQEPTSVDIVLGTCVCPELIWSCPTLCNAIDCSPPGWNFY